MEEFRTISGLRLGYTRDEGSRTYICDNCGRRLGYFDGTYTCNMAGKRLARGNILVAFLKIDID